MKNFKKGNQVIISDEAVFGCELETNKGIIKRFIPQSNKDENSCLLVGIDLEDGNYVVVSTHEITSI